MISHFTILTFSHVLLSGCRQFRVDHVDMKLFRPIVFVFPYNYFFLNSKLIFWNGFFEEITVAWNVCPGNREIYLINSPKIIKRDQMHTFPPVNNVKWFGSHALTDAASPNAGCGGQSGKRALHTEARARSNFFPRTSPLVFGLKPRERFWERGWIWLHCEGTLSALLLTPLGLPTSVSTYDTKKVGIKLSMRKKKIGAAISIL